MYKIGTISQLLGIPEHVLRFYEEKGLIHPKRKPHSPVRYYDEMDMFVLEMIVQLRGLGFSVDEVKSILSREIQNEAVDYYQLLSRKLEELEEEMRSLSLVQKEVGLLKDSYSLNRKCKEVFSRESMPEWYWIPNINGPSGEKFLRPDEETSRILMQKIMPAVRIAALVEGEELQTGSVPRVFTWGWIFSARYLSYFPEEARGWLRQLPAGQYLVSSSRENESGRLDMERVHRLCEEAQRELGQPPSYAIIEVLPGGYSNYFVAIPPQKQEEGRRAGRAKRSPSKK